METRVGDGGTDRERWTDRDRRCGADGVSRGSAAALSGALVSELGSADAAMGLVRAAQIPAGVLVDLGRGGPSAGTGLGAAILRSLAVGRARDGGEIPMRAGRSAVVFQLPSAVAPSSAHHQLGRRLVQTFAPLFEPLPRMPERRAQRAGSGLLPTRSRIDASMRILMSRSTLQLTFNRNGGQCLRMPFLDSCEERAYNHPFVIAAIG